MNGTSDFPLAEVIERNPAPRDKTNCGRKEASDELRIVFNICFKSKAPMGEDEDWGTLRDG
jgi:hypothetical protein